MDLQDTLLRFRNALETQDLDAIGKILKDKTWPEQLNANQLTINNILEKCKTDAQSAYEFLTLVKLLQEFFEGFNREEKTRLSNLKDALHHIVDSSNTDLNLYDLSFLADRKKEKPKQGVLGKSKKEGKNYPNIPTSALIIMNPEFWAFDVDVPYLDSTKGEKKGLKITLADGKLTRGKPNDKVDGKYLYVVSPKGGLYAMKETGRRKHSTVRAGQPVISAGHMEIVKGRITQIDSISGHYTPPPKQTLLACMILKEQNLIDENCEIRLYGHKPRSLRAILTESEFANLVAECRKTLSEERVANQEVISKLSKPKSANKPSVVQLQKESPPQMPIANKVANKEPPTSAAGNNNAKEMLKERVRGFFKRQGYRPAIDALEYIDNQAVIESFAGKPKAGENPLEIVNFENVPVKDGGTQSQRYACTLSDGRIFFIKQTAKQDHVIRQKTADLRIRQALGAYIDEAPFVYMLKGENLGANNGIAIFPNVTGYMLSDGSKKGKVLSEKNPESYKRIGAALSNLHIIGLLSLGQIEDFYATGCDLTEKNILVHDDFQASNIMLTDEGRITFVDTDAVSLIGDSNLLAKGDEYKNIFQLCEMCLGDTASVKCALEGYLSNYDVEKQAEILTNIQKVFSNKFKYEIPLDALPKPPIAKMVQAAAVSPIVQPTVQPTVKLDATKQARQPEFRRQEKAKPQAQTKPQAQAKPQAKPQASTTHQSQTKPPVVTEDKKAEDIAQLSVKDKRKMFEQKQEVPYSPKPVVSPKPIVSQKPDVKPLREDIKVEDVKPNLTIVSDIEDKRQKELKQMNEHNKFFVERGLKDLGANIPLLYNSSPRRKNFLGNIFTSHQNPNRAVQITDLQTAFIKASTDLQKGIDPKVVFDALQRDIQVVKDALGRESKKLGVSRLDEVISKLENGELRAMRSLLVQEQSKKALTRKL